MEQTPKPEYTFAFIDKKAVGREEQINEIIDRGGVVKFTNKLNGIVKFVRSVDKDADGDMTAFKSTGKTASVCWEASQYEVTEATPEEYT